MNSCLICDDHTMMREALAGSVQLRWPSAVISFASDFPTAWRAAAAQPDLCLCDLTMPGAPPIEGVGGVRAAAPKTPVLVVTGNEDDALLLALFDLGIAGFVPKTSSSGIIEAAIHLVLAGGRYLPPRVIDLAAQRGDATLVQKNSAIEFAHLGRLTERQLEILKRMALGESNKDIARTLGLSPATVKAHVAAVIAALGTANRTEAAVKARTLGLL